MNPRIFTKEELERLLTWLEDRRAEAVELTAVDHAIEELLRSALSELTRDA